MSPSFNHRMSPSLNHINHQRINMNLDEIEPEEAEISEDDALFKSDYTKISITFSFKSADDYYLKSSSADSIKHVSTPLICIQASNDPISPTRAIPRAYIEGNRYRRGNLHMVCTDVKLKLRPEGKFYFSATAGTDNVPYEIDFNLQDKVDVNESKSSIGSRTIVYLINKEYSKWWNRLLKQEGKTQAFVKVDWDKWVDEDEQDEKGLQLQLTWTLVTLISVNITWEVVKGLMQKAMKMIVTLKKK